MTAFEIDKSSVNPAARCAHASPAVVHNAAGEPVRLICDCGRNWRVLPVEWQVQRKPVTNGYCDGCDRDLYPGLVDHAPGCPAVEGRRLPDWCGWHKRLHCSGGTAVCPTPATGSAA